MRFALLALTLLACGGGGSDTDEPTPTKRDAYLEALCVLYSDPVCVDNQTSSCGGSLSFDSASDCTSFMRFALSGCTGHSEAMEDNADVDACIAALQAFDCGSEDICDTEGNLIAGGASCVAVDTLIQSYCPEDDTGGR